jgi:Bacterial Ig-like domain (group 3)/FG-GAP-like repeat/FG-GAP repeat
MKRRVMSLCVLWTLVLVPSFGSEGRPDTREQVNAHKSADTQNERGTALSQRAHRKQSNPPPTSIGFLSALQVPAGGSVYSIFPGVIGNFSGAGNPASAATLVDTGTAGTPNISISVALSAGNGTFTQALTSVQAVINSESVPAPIFAGDVNGDGFDDIVILNETAPASMSVWLNKADGSGTFTQGNTYPVTSNAALGATLTAAKPDVSLDFIVVDAANPGNVWTLKGNGDGTFQTSTGVSFSGQFSPAGNIIFADFNGDGFLDFAGLNATGNSNPPYQVDVYLNNGANTAYSGPTMLATPDHIFESCFNVAGSLSGHAGFADIVSANCDDGVHGRADNVTVYVNNNGTFAQGVYYSAGAWPTGLSIADMNGDGNNDLIVTDQEAGALVTMLGNGDGTLQPASVGYATGGGPRTGLPALVTAWDPALVADFNGDGHLDAMLPDFRINFAYLQGYGDGTFRSSIDYYATYTLGYRHPTSGGIASGDFNGDGIPDFVIGNTNDVAQPGGVTVFLANSDGSMQPGVTYFGATPTAQLSYVAVADFNGDGKLDIAATDAVNGGVQLFTGNGDGTFNTGATFASDSTTPYTTLGIVTADFNGDGHPDLAVVNTTSSGANSDVGVLLNDSNGGGNFTLKGNNAVAAPSLELATADINGDQKFDLAVPLSGTLASPGSAVAIFLGNGDGTFTPGTTVNLTNSNQGTFYEPIAAAIGDLNGDGIPDLIVSTDDQVPTSFHQGIVVALGNGDGTFQTPNFFVSSLTNGSDPMGIQLTDLNRDGHLDVLTANYKNGTVGLLYGRGDGTLYDPVEYATGLEPTGVALADVNGDGAVDVVTSGGATGFSGVNVLLNSSGDSTAATSSANPSQAGAPITLSATVTGSPVRGVTASPTGTVTFYDGTTALGSPVTLASGAAQMSVSTLAVGTHNLTAQYSGDTNFIPSTSPAIPQVVNQGTSSTGVTSSANPAAAGATVTFTATVTSTVSGNGIVPTGTVTFYDGSTSLGSGTLNSSGQASFVTQSLAVGTHSITGKYSGDTNFSASTSAALSQVISSTTQPDYTLSAKPTSQTVNPGSSASYTITVTSTNGYNGTVTLNCPSTPPASGVSCNTPLTLTSGTGTLTISTTGPTSALMRTGFGPQGVQKLWASLTGLGMFGLLLAGDWKNRSRKRAAIVLLVLAVVMILALVGCGGGSSSGGGGGGGGSGTPAGTYTINLTGTGTAGNNGGNTGQHTLSVTLVVQ